MFRPCYHLPIIYLQYPVISYNQAIAESHDLHLAVALWLQAPLQWWQSKEQLPGIGVAGHQLSVFCEAVQEGPGNGLAGQSIDVCHIIFIQFHSHPLLVVLHDSFIPVKSQHFGGCPMLPQSPSAGPNAH